MYVKIFALDGFDERLGHSVRLRRSYRREARHETNRLGERDGLVSEITPTVVRKPFDGRRGFLLAKASLDALEHEITDHLAREATGRCYPRDHSAITSVERKGDTNDRTVPARNLEAIRGPSEAESERDDLTIVGTTWRLTRVALQQEPILRHQAVNAFVVQPRTSCAFTLSIEQCPDPTVATCRPLIRQCSNGRRACRRPSSQRTLVGQ